MKNSFGFGNWHAICNSFPCQSCFFSRKGKIMLVLSRKAGEKILINGSITVEIVSLDRGKVRIGITAPSEVSVHRKEVHDRIHEFAEPAMATAELRGIPR